MDPEHREKKDEKDLYRDTAVRYLGYTNEVGESFRPIIGSKLVLASYGIASLYVLADAIHKTLKTYETRAKDPNRALHTGFAAADTLIWQILASIAIPGFTINRVVASSMWFLKKNNLLEKKSRRVVVAGIGLAVIPIIIHPIDHLVNIMMDNTFRRLQSQKVE